MKAKIRPHKPNHPGVYYAAKALSRKRQLELIEAFVTEHRVTRIPEHAEKTKEESNG